VDQSIRVWAYDEDGAAITGEAYNSAGIAVSVVVRSAGRILSTTALTLVARSGVGVHTDSAFTEVGGGEYVVDLADTYSATANRDVSVTLTSTAISGGYVLSETLAVGQAVELDSATLQKIDNILEDTGTTLPGLINAIEGGGGDNQEVLDAIDGVTASVAAYAARIALEVQLKGFPSVLCRNADYLEEVESEIRLTLEDVAGEEITEIAGTPVASLSWLFGAGTQTEPNLFDGTCSWDDDTDELIIEIPASETDGKKLGALTWQVGVTISEKTRWLGGGTTRLIERQF